MKDKNGIDTCPECGNRQDKDGVCEWCGHKENKGNRRTEV